MMPSVSVQERIRRQLFDLNIASNKRVLNQKTIIRGNDNNLLASPERLGHDGQEAQGFNVANAVLRDGADLLGTPVRWIKDMQQNWLVYMVCAAVIMSGLLVFYCVIRSRWSRRTSNVINPSSNLTELATIMAMKNITAASLTSKPVTEA